MVKEEPYEISLHRNIDENTALLQSLGDARQAPAVKEEQVDGGIGDVEEVASGSKSKGKGKGRAKKVKAEVEETVEQPSRKRKGARNNVDDEPEIAADETPSRTKKSKVEELASEDQDPSIRRSPRNAARPRIKYDDDNFDIHGVGELRLVNEGDVGNRLGERVHDPRVFGQIPGVAVGTWWEKRSQCSTAAIHAPFVAGIYGSSQDGAYSVALSGGYDDDVDLGYAFTYTGSGGRDLKGSSQKPKNLRTGPQVFDQSFDNPMNKSLQISAQTKLPVRVIRGYKLRSPWAPKEGYRYDGLYTVEKAWMAKGLGGYMVCKYAFQRMEGQPALVKREDWDVKEEEGA